MLWGSGFVGVHVAGGGGRKGLGPGGWLWWVDGCGVHWRLLVGIVGIWWLAWVVGLAGGRGRGLRRFPRCWRGVGSVVMVTG